MSSIPGLDEKEEPNCPIIAGMALGLVVGELQPGHGRKNSESEKSSSDGTGSRRALNTRTRPTRAGSRRKDSERCWAARSQPQWLSWQSGGQAYVQKARVGMPAWNVAGSGTEPLDCRQ